MRVGVEGRERDGAATANVRDMVAISLSCLRSGHGSTLSILHIPSFNFPFLTFFPQKITCMSYYKSSNKNAYKICCFLKF